MFASDCPSERASPRGILWVIGIGALFEEQGYHLCLTVFSCPAQWGGTKVLVPRVNICAMLDEQFGFSQCSLAGELMEWGDFEPITLVGVVSVGKQELVEAFGFGAYSTTGVNQPGGELRLGSEE